VPRAESAYLDAERARADARAQLEVSLGDLHAKIDKMGQVQRERAELDRLKRLIVPVPITAPQIPLSAGAGTLANQPDLLGPHEGYSWFVMQLSCMSFTAGTVSVYRNFAQDENFIVSFTQAGSFFFGSNQLYLGDSDMLLFSATGITGQVTISGWAVNVPTFLIPDYLL
jgi:hypothetical protein